MNDNILMLNKLLACDPSTIETIDLQYNRQDNINMYLYTKKLQEFADFIGHCKNIRSFTMKGYCFKEYQWIAILGALRNSCCDLEYLDMSQNRECIGGNQNGIVQNALQICSSNILLFRPCLQNIHTLDLSNTWFSDHVFALGGTYITYISVSSLRELLLTTTKHLRILKLNECKFYRKTDTFATLMDAIGAAIGIEIVSFTNTRIDDESQMCDAIANNRTIRNVIGISTECQARIKTKREDIRRPLLSKLKLLEHQQLPPEMICDIERGMNIPVPYGKK